MSKKSFRRALVIFAGILLLVGSVAGYFGYQFYTYPDRAHDGSGKRHEIVIERDRREKRSTVKEVAGRLAEAGVISHPRWFSYYASRYGLRLRPGKYLIEDNLTPREVFQILSFPPAVALDEVQDVQVTLKEGKNILDFANVLVDAKLAESTDEVISAVRDPEMVKKLGLPKDAPSLEGYLYPETYRFRPKTPLEQIFKRMIAEHRAVYAKVAKENAESLARVKSEFNWGDEQIVIMASLVEKETAAPDERPRIAAVFMNRLRDPKFQPKRLETDPTIVYGCTALATKSKACQKFSDRIRRAQLDDPDNPYNTYTHEGLPPGPIANPGKEAISAVMNPEGSGYLFFVSKNDGTHQFSKTMAEHTAAVNKYQR